MSTPTPVEDLLGRVSAGERLLPHEVTALWQSADVLSLGMIADAGRRHLHGARVTFLRVALWPVDAPPGSTVPADAREIRLTGSPATRRDAVAAVERAKTAAGDRLVSGFSWADVVRLAAADGATPPQLLAGLRGAGLEALAHVPIDSTESAAGPTEALLGAGFAHVRLAWGDGVQDLPAAMLRAAALQDRVGGIRALNPLPAPSGSSRPSTGYDDVKAVAIARIAAPNILTVQVDWHHYGPKLAQVALTFGADDLDGVPASDDAPHGARRAVLAEVRRNVEAAALVPAERDGRFNVVA